MACRILSRYAMKHKLSNFRNHRLLCEAFIDSSSQKSRGTFGLIFDIDGVLVRGRMPLPGAEKAFQRLVDSHGKFIFPTVFVTNSCYGSPAKKAQHLSQWLKVKISEEQVVMAYSPLKMFQQYFDQQVFVCGQGPVYDIVKEMGFKKISTIMDLRKSFPFLDAVDHQLQKAQPGVSDVRDEHDFPQIKAVLLVGEPLAWETALQLLIDLLVTNGLPSHAPTMDHYPHIPLLVCNMDLQWMAEACMPRFGHGAFLLCLESLYKKITGHDLLYTSLLGKPSLDTYKFAHFMLQQHAKQIGISCNVEKIYAFGDNICTDVFGANNYNQFLTSESASGSTFCRSILVKTGVYGGETHTYLHHFPRDFHPVDKKLCIPEFVIEDVFAGVELVFREEGIVS
ncbi:haloacid dehalogenase-like hydrolase domain-containing 5 isoform X2 [Bacillus rossius redtenbacheri]|uniref:haloacid dehalogenase-like hydrolase domain-containing 5 isoform X2 n=1 Tax=Bacillus rossius redtenbacheri TaxID=93214 RepID=UPI002FDD2204